MSRYRRAAKVDDAQKGIVKALISIPGISVALGHDDVLVGYQGATYWYEIKSPSSVKKNGLPRKGSVKESQQSLLLHWTGHYKLVFSIDEILADLGIKP